MKKNRVLCYFDGSLYNLVAIFISGGILQSFLLEIGYSAQTVAIFVSVMQAAQILAMLVFSPILEDTPNVIKLYSNVHLLLLPIIIAMLFAYLGKEVSLTFKFPVLLLCGAVTYVGLGLLNFLAYKLSYQIFDMNYYGEILAVQGIFCGISSVLVSYMVTRVSAGGNYLKNVSIVLVVCIGIVLVDTIIGHKFRDLGLNRQEKEKSKINLLHYRPFRALIIPFFIRGFAIGTFGLFTTIGYYLGTIDSVLASKMVLASNIAVLFTFVFYRKFALLHKEKELLVVAGLIMLVLFPLSFSIQLPFVFLSVYFIEFCLRTVFETVAPVSLVPIMDYDVVSQYSAWRGALHMTGIVCSGIVTIPMIERIGIVPTMIFNGILLLISSIINYSVIRNMTADGV